MRRFDEDARTLAAIAVEAGRFLAAVQDRGAGRALKADGTVATAADLEAERLITARLAQAFPDVPVVAEESCVAGSCPDGAFFLVDPLDGTRDYLSGTGEYSVNIALVSAGRPVAAALAAPSLARVWAAGGDAVAAAIEPDRIGDWAPARVRRPGPGGLLALVSRRHGDDETERCLGGLAIGGRREISSAAKFGLVASGEADLYVRCGPTMEWDTAAGDHIVTRAGGLVMGPDRGPLRYGAAPWRFRNGPFAALGDPALAAAVALPGA